jgi:hypothetical protein
MKILQTLVLCFFTAATLAQKATVKTLKKELFKIQYPHKWTIDTSGMMGSEFFIFSPVENVNDKFRENVSLIIQDISGQNIDLDKYAEISKEQINTMAGESTIHESKKMKKGKSEFYKMIYEFREESLKVKIEQYYFVTNSRAYVLTLATESTKFANFKSIGEGVLNSFQVTEK